MELGAEEYTSLHAGVEYELDLEEYTTSEDVRGKRLRIIHMDHPHDVMPAIFFFHGAGGQAEQWREQLKYAQ